MATEHGAISITDIPALQDVVHEVSRTHEPRRVFVDGEEVTIIIEPNEYLPVSFCEDDFIDFVSELRERYGDEWISLAIDEEDPATGMTRGKLIAHDISGGVVGKAGTDYVQAHPGVVIRVFSTTMAPRRRRRTGR